MKKKNNLVLKIFLKSRPFLGLKDKFFFQFIFFNVFLEIYLLFILILFKFKKKKSQKCIKFIKLLIKFKFHHDININFQSLVS